MAQSCALQFLIHKLADYSWIYIDISNSFQYENLFLSTTSTIYTIANHITLLYYQLGCDFIIFEQQRG